MKTSSIRGKIISTVWPLRMVSLWHKHRNVLNHDSWLNLKKQRTFIDEKMQSPAKISMANVFFHDRNVSNYKLRMKCSNLLTNERWNCCYWNMWPISIVNLSVLENSCVFLNLISITFCDISDIVDSVSHFAWRMNVCIMWMSIALYYYYVYLICINH